MIKKCHRKINSLLLVVVLMVSYSVQAQLSDERPNIIVVLTDDMGYADVGFNGGKDVKTPQLDKLANEGTVFSSAYVIHPFCGPSRAGLLTGRYPHEFGSQFNLPANSKTYGHEGIDVSETFFSKVLQNAGYTTGAFGKWHLGMDPQYHPNKRGFDEFYGFLGGGHLYFPEEYTEKYNTQKQKGNTNIWEYLTPLEHNGKEVVETEYMTDALSREAVKFVKDATKKEEPFFMYLAYNAPHTPLEAKKEDLKLFENITDENRKTYAAMVYAVDRGVGELVKALKETGEYDNTLIVFLSDNGGRPDKGANNYPLKGRKGDTYEGGFRVPMFFHWPGHVPANNVFSDPVSALDFYPTFVELARTTIPKAKVIEGKDIMEYVINGTNPRPEDMIFAMRHRSGYSDVGVRLNEWKATKAYNGKWMLFNINKDIGETNDLSKSNPKQLEKMVEGAEEWSKKHVEPRWFDPESLSEEWKEKQMGKFKTTFKL